MPDGLLTKPDAISVDRVCQAVNRVVFDKPAQVEAPAQHCAFPRLCGKTRCRFPRYFDGEPVGVVANTLIRLGFSSTLLKDLDCEYEMGELIHPGVKIGNSRNQALARIDPKGMALLAWLQAQGKHRLTLSQLHVQAFRPRKGMRYFDRRRRPWLY